MTGSSPVLSFFNAVEKPSKLSMERQPVHPFEGMGQEGPKCYHPRLGQHL